MARYNPVDWAVVASREALSANIDWGASGRRLGLLVALAVAMAWLGTRAFGSYQRPSRRLARGSPHLLVRLCCTGGAAGRMTPGPTKIMLTICVARRSTSGIPAVIS